jgi:hypothetical protein
MENQQQQESRSEPDEEPADPTSAAVRLANALSIIAHVTPNLFPTLVIATHIAVPCCVWTNPSAGLVCDPLYFC